MSTEDRPTPRDLAWLVAAAVVAGFTGRYLWDIATLIATGEGDTRDLVLLLVVGAVIAVGGIWLTLGAWRRTRWGRPEGE